jgi:hypothetical protein
VFTIGIDPHKGSHTGAVVDGTEIVIDELRLVADGINAIGCWRWPRGSSHAPGRSKVPAGSVPCWPNSSSLPARPSSTCPDAVGSGAAGRLDPQRQNRLPGRTRRRNRGDATRPTAAGRSRRSLRGAPAAGGSPSRPHRTPHPSDLPAARPAVPAHRRRRLRAPFRPAGWADPAWHRSARARCDRAQAHRPGPTRRCPPVRQPARHAQ